MLAPHKANPEATIKNKIDMYFLNDFFSNIRSNIFPSVANIPEETIHQMDVRIKVATLATPGSEGCVRTLKIPMHIPMEKIIMESKYIMNDNLPSTKDDLIINKYLIIVSSNPYALAKK